MQHVGTGSADVALDVASAGIARWWHPKAADWRRARCLHGFANATARRRRTAPVSMMVCAKRHEGAINYADLDWRHKLTGPFAKTTPTLVTAIVADRHSGKDHGTLGSVVSADLRFRAGGPFLVVCTNTTRGTLHCVQVGPDVAPFVVSLLSMRTKVGSG